MQGWVKRGQGDNPIDNETNKLDTGKTTQHPRIKQKKVQD